MPTIVLRDQEDQDIGFLLVAGDDPISIPGVRDVIFMALPIPAPSGLAEFVKEFRHVEFNAQITLIGANSQISFSVSPDISFLVSISQSGTGQWSASTVGSGFCQLLGSG